MSEVPLYARGAFYVALLRMSIPQSLVRNVIGFLGGRGTTRAEDAQGTPTQSHISRNLLVYEEEKSKWRGVDPNLGDRAAQNLVFATNCFFQLP